MSNTIKLWDIHGGIHPEENKTQSTQQPIRKGPLPKKLYLPLQQHIGAPSELLVKEGDRVLKGQCIAQASGFVSASLHAPTSGTITAIETRAVPHPSGLTAPTVILESDGKDEWTELNPIGDFRQLDPMDLVTHIRDHGIAGMGGAGFPSAVKLSTKEGQIDTLIINGAECEPYITSDHLLMREKAQQVIEGIAILGHILKVKRCIIGVEDNKQDAANALKAELTKVQNTLAFPVIVAVIPTKYPSGGEKQLIQILTGKEVPHGSIPADLGIVCQNVGTTAAIAQAVTEGIPLISRITTVTGEAVADKGNFETLLGTSIEDLLYHCATDHDDLSRLVMGGPMMGFTLHSTDLPVVKTTNCILAATEQELPQPAPAQDCIRCGMCAEACPVELLPQQLYWFSRAKEFDKAKHFNLFDCIECGACSFVCPSHIPLVQYYRFAKGSIRQEEQDHIKSERAKQKFEARQARLAKEEAEKEAKRQARAEAAAKAKAAKEAAAKQTETTTAPAETDDKKAAIAAAVARAKTKKAESSNSGVDIKALKVASSQARAAYLKAQRALDAEKEAGKTSEELASQEKEVAELQQAFEKSKQALDDAKSGSPVAGTASTKKSSDNDTLDNKVKQLKVDTSQARAAAKQAQKAVDQAKEDGSDEATLKQLETDLAVAVKKYEKLNAAKLVMQEKLKNQKAAATKAPAITDSASTNDQAEASNTEDPAALVKKLKVEASQTKAAMRKLERELEAAEQDGSATESLKTQVIEAKQAYEKANAAKIKATEDLKNGVMPSSEQPAKANTVAEKDASNAEEQTEDLAALVKKLKVEASQSKAAMRKLERELESAEQDNSVSDELKAKVAEAKAVYEAANAAKLKATEDLKNGVTHVAKPISSAAEKSKSQEIEPEPPQTEDIETRAKQLKVAASKAKAALRKLERAYDAAKEDGQDTSELEQQVVAAKSTYDQANDAKIAAMNELKNSKSE